MLLSELSRAHMLTEHAAGRYTLQAVLRSYAVGLAQREPEAVRRAAVRRLLDHYLHTAVAADRWLDASRAPIDLPAPAPGTITESIDSILCAQRWFKAEWAGLLEAVRLAHDSGFANHAWRLAWAMASFLDRAELRPAWTELPAPSTIPEVVGRGASASFVA